MGISSQLPLFEQIADSIRKQILAGELKPGSRIPPVRTVARRWDCTPGTVSRAYQLLAREGLVIGHPGKGTIVVEGIAALPQPALGWAALVHRAETFLLEAVQDGFSLPNGEVAVAMAAAHLRETLEQAAPIIQNTDIDRDVDLRFAGSHDMSIEVLARFLAGHTPPYILTINYAGSLGGLMAMARNEADLCGVHLWDAESDSYNTPFISHIMPDRSFLLLTVAHRHLGLILPPGNPDQIKGLEDLVDPEVRFQNRQPGSGTRVWLDRQLRAIQLDPGDIPGYHTSQPTHTAVASAVANGEASVGVGIQAAAAGFDLDFISLAREPYELVIPDELVEESAAQALIGVVQSQQLKDAIRLVGGYEDSQTGSIRWIQ